MTEPPPVLHPSGGPRNRQDPGQTASGLPASSPAAIGSPPSQEPLSGPPRPPVPERPAPEHSATSEAMPSAALPAEAAASTGAVPSAAAGPENAVPAASRPAAVPASAPDGPVVVAAPLAALLEPAADGLALPRIGADGLAPMQAYAQPFQAAPGAKLVAVVLDGIGLSEADSLAAINVLPGAIDLAVSPYAPHPEALLRQARLKGHELLASIPMEPAGAPLNDEGGRALTIDATPEANAANLAGVLGRFGGYVGATGGSDGQRGEHFALSGRPFAAVAEGLAARGLLYVDTAGTRLPAQLASCGVDLVVDEPAGAASLNARLARLEAAAQENGAAVGLAGPPRPVTVERLAAWAKGLAARGLVLAPVSALVRTGRSALSGTGPSGVAGGGPASGGPVRDEADALAMPTAATPHGQVAGAPSAPGVSAARRAP